MKEDGLKRVMWVVWTARMGTLLQQVFAGAERTKVAASGSLSDIRKATCHRNRPNNNYSTVLWRPQLHQSRANHGHHRFCPGRGPDTISVLSKSPVRRAFAIGAIYDRMNIKLSKSIDATTHQLPSDPIYGTAHRFECHRRRGLFRRTS